MHPDGLNLSRLLTFVFLFSWVFFSQDKAEDSADVAEPLYMIDNARFDLVFPA